MYGKPTDEDGIYRVPAQGTKPASEKAFGEQYAGTIGTAYGYITKKYEMTQKLIETLKNNPTDRRMIMSLWQDAFLDTAVLPSCVWNSMWDVTNGKLNAVVTQRSCDVALGLPFNVTQYAALQMMLAQVTGLEPGTLYWSTKDAHLYINQLEGIKEQLRRYEELGDFEAPELWLNPEIDDFFKFDNSKELKDINIPLNLRVEVGSFLSFADFFFDGFVADYLVQSKIAEAREQIDYAIYKVENILNDLKNR